MTRIAPRATSHAGDRLADGMRVFALPPPEIGDVRSVGSTMQAGEKPVTLSLRALRTSVLVAFSAVAVGVVSLVPIGMLVWLLRQLGVGAPLTEAIAAALTVVAAAVGAWFAAPIAWEVNGPVASCTYVGKDGLARHTWGDPLPRVVLRFEDARALVKVVRTRQKGDSNRVEFDLRWMGRRGAFVAFRIHGVYEGERPTAGARPEHQEYLFAVAAERAWNEWLLRKAREDVESHGALEIGRDARDLSRRARIGREFIELFDGERVERWSAIEVDEIHVKGGTVVIRRIDPMRGKRSIERRYPGSAPGAMDNESFFPLALREIAGLPVEQHESGLGEGPRAW
ncbi:hypothetical protein [Polyangium jinanense]|uniref:Uncharacterized protein n=1 Tax=Polyangium jinanense TaxID=2829994 RepID=A0A9X4AYC7_9BACT|nr:hypothetical protein [Polyangium jinanense]MDC3962913.1 hypothetical protein [Polyangium jinanense]MDC3989603.1 hypothetical protein [Polyangium jinanense]